MKIENWYDEAIMRLENVEKGTDEKSKKILKLDLLKRILKFKNKLINEGCQECVDNIDYIEEMLTLLELNHVSLNKMPRDYKVLLNNLLEHLQVSHKITVRHEYTIVFAKNLGTIGGLVSLFFFDDYFILLGTLASLILGMVLGALLDYRKKIKKLML